MFLYFYDVIYEKVLDIFGSFGYVIVSILVQFQIFCDFIWFFFEKRMNVFGWYFSFFDENIFDDLIFFVCFFLVDGNMLM